MEIGFFIYAGTPRLGDELEGYIYRDKGLKGFLDEGISGELGGGLQLILVRLLIEDPFGTVLPAKGVGPFNKRQKATGTNIPIMRAEFEALSNARKAQFVVDAVTWSVSAVSGKLAPKVTDFDFPELENQVRSACDRFLAQWKRSD